VAWTLAELAEELGGLVHGNPDHTINNVATLANAGASDITFLANTKYKKYLADCQAGAVLVSANVVDAVPTNAIEVKDPYVAYAKAAALLFPEPALAAQIHPSAVIHETAQIGNGVHIAAQAVIGERVKIADDAVIGPGCVLLDDVVIGKASRLTANVTLCKKVRIGERVVIHPGVVIGADGFGIANDQGRWIKVPQLGSVVIGNDVEIGANTTIDRGAIEDTLIADGVKLDNQIQIGHNVTIGENTVIAGCAGIAGSTHIGANCAIGGGTGMAGHIEIADGVQLTGMSMVTKSVTESGVYSSGIPLEPSRQWHKNVIRYRQLETLFERVKQLEESRKD
jgi:UDP-3-O-[3-hydroxymyristoyl] glucosamine N-acyltransferase